MTGWRFPHARPDTGRLSLHCPRFQAIRFICGLLPGLMFGLVLLLETGTLAAQVRDYSIPEFVARKQEWRDWIGQTLRLEGRYSSFTRTAMQFQKCDLFFYLPPDANRPGGRSKTMEVTGSLKLDRGELIFQVDSFRLLAADGDLFDLRKRALPPNKPEPWYQLGQQTVARGTFYDDTSLIILGREVLIQGLQLEKSGLENPTAAALRELASKAARLDLPDRIRLPLLHESLLLSVAEADLAKKPIWATLREQIQAQLPGSQLPLTEWKHPILDVYRKQPAITYEKASDAERQLLAREFYLQVARREFTGKLQAGGANGQQLASEYAQVAPDDPVTAENFRQQALTFRLQNLNAARRSEVQQLASDYQAQHQPEMARTAQKNWLEHQRRLLPNAGPSDFLQTALDFAEWLEDRSTAERILLDGIQKFPQDAGLQTQLQRWDYAEQPDGWKPRSEIPITPQTRMQAAIQAGHIVPGMTPEQVRAALGAPQTTTRIVSAQSVHMLWNYPDARLAIQFQQLRTRNEYQVISVQPLQQSTPR